jgi:hypothetical protein
MYQQPPTYFYFTCPWQQIQRSRCGTVRTRHQSHPGQKRTAVSLATTGQTQAYPANNGVVEKQPARTVTANGDLLELQIRRSHRRGYVMIGAPIQMQHDVECSGLIQSAKVPADDRAVNPQRAGVVTERARCNLCAGKRVSEASKPRQSAPLACENAPVGMEFSCPKLFSPKQTRARSPVRIPLHAAKQMSRSKQQKAYQA